MAKTQYTFVDQLGSVLFKLCIAVLLLFMFNALEFNISIHKKKNSLLSTVGETVEQGYSTFKTVKGLIK